jgi:hypothetical protein
VDQVLETSQAEFVTTMIGNERRDSFLGRLCHISQDFGHDKGFRRVRKATKVIVSFMSGHPSFSMEQVGSQWVHFLETFIGNIYYNMSRIL